MWYRRYFGCKVGLSVSGQRLRVDSEADCPGTQRATQAITVIVNEIESTLQR